MESNIVDRHVVSLREKLETDPHRARYIATVYGEGYRLIAGEDESAETLV